MALLSSGLLRRNCSTALVAHWLPGFDSPLPRLVTQAQGWMGARQDGKKRGALPMMSRSAWKAPSRLDSVSENSFVDDSWNLRPRKYHRPNTPYVVDIVSNQTSSTRRETAPISLRENSTGVLQFKESGGFRNIDTPHPYSSVFPVTSIRHRQAKTCQWYIPNIA